MEHYIFDDSVTLRMGMDDGEEVPRGYVRALQEDLDDFGFSPGDIDGRFGRKTDEALRTFQRCAEGEERLGTSGVESVGAEQRLRGTHAGWVDEATRVQIHLWHEEEWLRPPSCTRSPARMESSGVPAQPFDIPFAEVSRAARYWPIRTDYRMGRMVAFQGTDRDFRGSAGRRFGAKRSEGRRYHVGVDLYGNNGDLIVACEPGRIVNAFHFYRGTYALFVQCDSGLVINYGEVAKNSWKAFGLDVGDEVEGGQLIARVGKMRRSSMCHFETYVEGTTSNKRFLSDQRPPRDLLNPTRYLLHLASSGE